MNLIPRKIYLISVLLTAHFLLFSQTKYEVFISKPRTFSSKYHILLLYSDKCIYEKYGTFKGSYYLLEQQDTLSKLDENNFKGNKYSIVFKEKVPVITNTTNIKFKNISYCDSGLNTLRNTSYYLTKRTINYIDEYIKIGTHVSALRNLEDKFEREFPVSKICSNTYFSLVDSFLIERKNFINQIYKRKCEILEQALDSTKDIPTETIDEFIKQSRDNATDQLIFHFLLVNHISQFLSRLELLNIL